MRERFNGLEWPRLVRLPAVVYYAVAAADGRADQYEESRFLEYVNQSNPVDPLVRSVFDELVEQGRGAARLSEYERDWVAYVRDTRSLLDSKLSAQERLRFLAGILGVGHQVAAASGGFFGLGNKVSAVEAQRLEELSESLGLKQLLEQA